MYSEGVPIDSLSRFFEACRAGNPADLRRMVRERPSLVHAAAQSGWTGLHEAARAGRTRAVAVLLAAGADPNVREKGDNTYPLHWAAAARHVEVVRLLLDHGGDVDGFGDVHELDAIGWATLFHPHGETFGVQPEVAELLVERGARHHIFSALSLADRRLIRRVAQADPSALTRRLSRFEGQLTPLHFAMKLDRLDLMDLLIDLGAPLGATDREGHTVLEVAMLNGNTKAMNRLVRAGAKLPKRRAAVAAPVQNIDRYVAMIYAPDVAETLEWYESIGFREVARYEDDGLVNFGVVTIGSSEILINMHGKRGEHDVSLWFYTQEVDAIYERLKNIQFEAMRRGKTAIEFAEHINDTFYHARQFAIRDLNGYTLYFMKRLEA